MSEQTKKVTEKDIASDPLTRTYRIPKSLLHHLDDVFMEMKVELRDEDYNLFEYQVLIASLKMGLQDWYDNKKGSQLYAETMRVIELRKK